MEKPKQILSNRAKIGLKRIGDILCPQNGEFPSYTQSGAIDFVDEMLIYAPASDISDLGLLLSILSFMPNFVLHWVVKKMTNSHAAGDGSLAVIFRQLDFGLKGIILGTYYSGKRSASYSGKLPTEIIDFQINRMEL
jgi:hypothetical protein